jgi:ribonucleoside-diphosphate reductase alpha chain
MAVGNALIEMYEEMRNEVCCDEDFEEEKEVVTHKKEVITQIKAKCPECGSPITFEGGCNICKNCGWSKCD